MLDFIKRERIYFLMLIFIVGVNLLNVGSAHHKDQYKEERVEKESFSNKSFKDLGITEERVREYLESGHLNARFFRYFITLGFLVFLAALALNLVFIFRRKKIEFGSTQDIRPVSWGAPDLIRAVIVILFMAYLLAIIQGLILKSMHMDLGENLRMIINTFFVDIVVGAVVVYFVAVKYKEKLQDLGLRFSSFVRNVSSGIMAYIFVLPVLMAVLILSIWVLNLLGYTPPPQPVLEAFMAEERNRVLLFLTIFVSVLGPLVEEIFFRGFMYPAVKKHLGPIGSALLTASIFSALHTNIVGFLPIMILGLLLAYLYEVTGSLVSSVTVHIIHNSIIVSLVFFVKELLR